MQRQEAWGTSWAPLTLALIAAVLRNSGFPVSLIDCTNDGVGFSRLKKIIENIRPDLIVVNTATPSINSDLKVALVAGEVDARIKTVFLGIHVTALPNEVFEENPHVEYIVSGEPEYTIRDLAYALKEGRPINEIKGLIHRVKDEIVINEPRPFIEDLDDLPFPAWDLVKVDGYRLPITNRPFLLVLTGRGCNNSCRFCAAGTFYGKKPRTRTWHKIADEIKYARDRFGVNDFLFWAENGVADKQQLYEICRALISDVPGVKWVCNGRVDMIDEDLLRIMKKAGCWMIGYGIESGTQKILDLMNKNITISEIERAVELTKKYGIEVTAHVMAGYPGETREDILSTLQLLKRIDPEYMQAYCCVPFPGSLLYEEALRSGWLKNRDWAEFEQSSSIIDTPDLSARDVISLRKHIIRKFNLNPRKIIQLLSRIRSLRDVIPVLLLGVRYFRSWAGDQNK